MRQAPSSSHSSWAGFGRFYGCTVWCRAHCTPVRLLSDAVVVLPGGIDVLADLLTLLTEQALAAWRPNGGGDVRAEVAWLRISDSGVALLPTPEGLRLPGGPRRSGERGAVALSRVMAEGGSVPLLPERLHPVAALMVPDADGGWRRVSCYRVDGPQPVVPGAVSHPLGETAACEPAAAALQDLLRRGRIP